MLIHIGKSGQQDHCILFSNSLTSLCIWHFIVLFSRRSPWSNKYHPPLEDGSIPNPQLRELEVEANDIFAVYRDQWGPLLNLCECYCFDSNVIEFVSDYFIESYPVPKTVMVLFFLFCIFRYYEGGVSSVYMWEDDNHGFVACFLIKKGLVAGDYDLIILILPQKF